MFAIGWVQTSTSVSTYSGYDVNSVSYYRYVMAFCVIWCVWARIRDNP